VTRLMARLLIASVLLASACRPVALAQPNAEPQRLTRILIAVDVDDDVDLCVQPTAWMMFDDPGIVAPVCGLTVGELRAWLRRQARAD
jgi:hypothetical protein